MSADAWTTMASSVSPSLGANECAAGYSDALQSGNGDLLSAIDDYARSDGPTDDLLAQIAPAAKGDLIVVFTFAGQLPAPKPKNTVATNSGPPAWARLRGSRPAAGDAGRRSPAGRPRLQRARHRRDPLLRRAAALGRADLACATPAPASTKRSRSSPRSWPTRSPRRAATAGTGARRSTRSTFARSSTNRAARVEAAPRPRPFWVRYSPRNVSRKKWSRMKSVIACSTDELHSGVVLDRTR